MLAGVWVGLAFQAKMVEAWAVLPALAAAYLLAAPIDLRRRIAHTVVAGATTAVVSLSWMCFVALTPAAQRPYVDGSRDNSIFQQVFRYNASAASMHPSPETAARGRQAGPLLAVHRATRRGLVASPCGLSRPRYRLAAAGRRVSLFALLWVARSRDRTDPARAAVVLWGTWLLVFFVGFSAGGRINPYYLAALLRDRRIDRARSRRCLAGGEDVAGALGCQWITAAICAGYAIWLIPTQRVSDWLPAAVAAVALAAIALTGLALARRTAPLRLGAFATLLAAVLLAPTVAAASLTVDTRGPFDTPFQPATVTAATQTFAGAAIHLPPALIDTFEQAGQGTRYPLADLHVTPGGAPHLRNRATRYCRSAVSTAAIPCPPWKSCSA